MAQKDGLDRVRKMAAMVRELRAASLAKATAEREATRAKIAALDCLPEEDAMQDMGAAQRFFAYERWAAGRRVQLTQQLARQEVIWLSELDDARRAFGREQVLTKIQEKLEREGKARLSARRAT